MRLGADHVRVRVPATSANLGPGFDSLGLALGHHDELEVRTLGTDEVRVDVVGEGAGEVPSDERHLVVTALRRGLDHVGAPRTGLHLSCTNRIPHGRGMGSSAAAVVSGLLAARGLVEDPESLDDATVLALATELEGHPDNAAPAVYGGATVAWTSPTSMTSSATSAGTPRAARLVVHPDVETTVVVPVVRLATKTARGVLPATVPHGDAAFTAGRAALLVHALSSDPTLLLDATEDRLHQGYRSSVMPSTWDLVQRLRDRGEAATVSGAGPTVLVTGRRQDRARLSAVLDELLDGTSGWAVLRPEIDRTGAVVERL